MISKILILIHIFIALTAFAGGLGLIFMDGLGMSTEWLSDSPFNSYVIPGLILFVMVGGINLIASITLIKGAKNNLHLSIIAGLTIIIFEFFELYIITQPHILQLFYLGLGILIITLATLKPFTSRA